MGEQDAELVTAEAPDNVGFAGAGEEDVRDFQQHAVAGGMAIKVIHALEIVEIDEDQGQRCLEAAREGDLAFQLPLEGAAVEDRAERVMVGQQGRVCEVGAQAVGLIAKGEHFLGQGLDGGAGAPVKPRKINPKRVQEGVHRGGLRGSGSAGHGVTILLIGPGVEPRQCFPRSRERLTAPGALLWCALSSSEAGMNTPPNPVVGIIMGSQSDWPVMREAAKVLEDMGIAHEVRIVSAHRTPQRLVDYATSARDRGLKVIIAGAGGAAHLPGMVAAMTPLPVLGVPVQSKALKGLDSLLSMVQMPKGVPVGTLAIGEAGAANAGLLAASIIALQDEGVAAKLDAFRKAQTEAVGEAPEA